MYSPTIRAIYSRHHGFFQPTCRARFSYGGSVLGARAGAIASPASFSVKFTLEGPTETGTFSANYAAWARPTEIYRRIQLRCSRHRGPVTDSDYGFVASILPRALKALSAVETSGPHRRRGVSRFEASPLMIGARVDPRTRSHGADGGLRRGQSTVNFGFSIQTRASRWLEQNLDRRPHRSVPALLRATFGLLFRKDALHQSFYFGSPANAPVPVGCDLFTQGPLRQRAYQFSKFGIWAAAASVLPVGH